MPQLANEPQQRQDLRQARTVVTYHEAEVGPGRAFEIVHAEGAQIVPLGGEATGGGAAGGGWTFKYALLEPAVVEDENERQR